MSLASILHIVVEVVQIWDGSGFALHSDEVYERLTNIRYADDIIMFAKTLDEAQLMIEFLVEIFAECGLELNAKKTKILSTTTTNTQQVALITEYGAVDIVPKSSTHKYLGRAFSGDLRDRGSVALSNRSSCAWMQYNNLKHVLENKHVTLQLRFKLFESVITSTILYSLENLSIAREPLRKVRYTST